MKYYTALFLTAALLTGITSCKKRVDIICGDNIYSKWQVNTITAKSYVYPKGLEWDTTYDALPSDYIDLSTKGEIDFYINGQSHTDTYDTTKYDLSKDTIVPVVYSGRPGMYHVSVTSEGNSKLSLDESVFGIDTKSELLYQLSK